MIETVKIYIELLTETNNFIRNGIEFTNYVEVSPTYNQTEMSDVITSDSINGVITRINNLSTEFNSESMKEFRKCYPSETTKVKKLLKKLKSYIFGGLVIYKREEDLMRLDEMMDIVLDIKIVLKLCIGIE